MNEAQRGRIPVLARGSNPWVLESHKMQKNMAPVRLEPRKTVWEARALPICQTITSLLALSTIKL